MTHNSNHREPLVQKAGQIGTALPIQPLPRNFGVRWLAAAFGKFPRENQPTSGSSALASNQSSAACGFDVFPQSITGGADRVAGGEPVSNQTSTAALASFSHDLLTNQRRAPRHLDVFGRARLFTLSGAKDRGEPSSSPNSRQRSIP